VLLLGPEGSVSLAALPAKRLRAAPAGASAVPRTGRGSCSVDVRSRRSALAPGDCRRRRRDPLPRSAPRPTRGSTTRPGRAGRAQRTWYVRGQNFIVAYTEVREARNSDARAARRVRAAAAAGRRERAGSSGRASRRRRRLQRRHDPAGTQHGSR
jgi:hypothetical protein